MGSVAAIAGASLAQSVIGGVGGKAAAGQAAQGFGNARISLRESEETARGDFQPFTDVGKTDLQGLGDLITDPERQRDFITQNPFFDALAGRATSTLLANQAAAGKVGSGGTAEALQNSLLLLGTDLLNQNINQRFDLANLGLRSASGQAGVTTSLASPIAQTFVGQGQAKAAGTRALTESAVGGIGDLTEIIAL